MTSVLNIEPNTLEVKEKNSDMRYGFLNHINNHKININKYYSLLNSIDLFKLKNVYNFIYLRTYKINRMSEGYIDILPKKDGRISGEEINTLFNNYIKHENEKTKYMHAIIIMNGIQLYFFPSISLL